jgi:hypothetical protein
MHLLVVPMFALFISSLISYIVVERFRGGGALDHPTRCVSCERALPKELAWMGQPTKCFSCERELVNRTGDPSAGFGAHAVRYYK